MRETKKSPIVEFVILKGRTGSYVVRARHFWVFGKKLYETASLEEARAFIQARGQEGGAVRLARLPKTDRDPKSVVEVWL